VILVRFVKSALAAAAALALSHPGIAAPSPDEALVQAYDAWRAGDAMKFAKVAQGLESHALAPWLEYWRLGMRLEDVEAGEVQKVLAQHGSTYAGELLRTDWAKLLGRRGAWDAFDRESAALPRPDLELRCYSLASRLAKGDEGALKGAALVWLEPAELPPGCQTLASTLHARGELSVAEIWQRVRILFEEGHITAAKEALGFLPKREAPDERLLAEAARAPKRVIERLPKNLKRQATREVVVLAGVRYARKDPEAMALALERSLHKHLSEREEKYLWGRVAVEGARQHHEKALAWYARAAESRLDDHQLAWKVRAALRKGGQWRTVRATIDRMSAAGRKDPAWTYWYARALEALGEEAGARAYYLKIAGNTDFYGLLANEELGYLATLPESSYVPSEEEVEAAGRDPGLVRSLTLIRLGLRTEGVREWLHAIRGFDDARLLAAAELARRAEIYDRAISAADRTERLHNFSLRYPVPFQDVFREYARSQKLEEAWVLGLVRQESRFITYARSSAGAEGLMQIMPRTARYVAHRIGMRGYKPKAVIDVETNVTLGTGYLRLVLDDLGHPVLASAAYNAGPSRAKRWRDARPLEGAIYAETIPFGETRDYVKKVMANAVFYAALLERRVSPLKTRLGTVPARVPGEVVADDELP
jgi:soluble lytic murein transglycosylase